jgi:hypothetical protein
MNGEEEFRRKVENEKDETNDALLMQTKPKQLIVYNRKKRRRLKRFRKK